MKAKSMFKVQLKIVGIIFFSFETNKQMQIKFELFEFDLE